MWCPDRVHELTELLNCTLVCGRQTDSQANSQFNKTVLCLKRFLLLHSTRAKLHWGSTFTWIMILHKSWVYPLCCSFRCYCLFKISLSVSPLNFDWLVSRSCIHTCFSGAMRAKCPNHIRTACIAWCIKAQCNALFLSGCAPFSSMIILEVSNHT